MQSTSHPIVVVGAGAAGLLAALFAARHGRDVVLLERTEDGGKKILISGGGMCNLTNCDSTDHFLASFGLKKKANFLKPALLNLNSEDTRE